MSCGALWAKTTASKELATKYLHKYGHLLKWKSDEENVLDVGCADGSVTRTVLFPYIKDHVYSLTAIDKLEPMIDFANNENKIEQIQFLAVDIMDRKSVEKFKNQFGHIFSFLVSHWIIDNRTYLSNLREMLKPGGQIFLTQMTNDHPLAHSFKKQLSDETWLKYVPQEWPFPDYTDTPVEYVRNICQEVGLKVELCDCQKESSVIERLAEYVRPLLHMYKHYKRIPIELREEFCEYHRTNISEVCTILEEPDKYRAYYEILVCIASKDE